MLKPKRSSTDKKISPAKSGAVTRAVLWVRQRLGRGVRKTGVAPARQRKGSVFDAAELKLVRHDLANVLDQHPEARTVMRFVHALEHGLINRGRRALDELPVEVLRRAMGQLDAVVVDWSSEGLASLRSRAAVSIAERDRIASRREAAQRLASYSEVEVEEASVTTFMEANEEWERSLTGQSGAAPLDALERETAAETQPG